MPNNIVNIGLGEDVLFQIIEVIKRYPQVNKVVLFGSRALGNFKPGSDIDLALFGSGVNSSIINQISLALDDLFLAQQFDLIGYESIDNEALKIHIDTWGVELFS